MKRPYENQYIGAFIYMLGIVAGKGNREISDSINLIQQTPLDHPFGDLLGDWQGKKFIIEFKRDVNSLEIEMAKPQRLALLRNIREGNGELRSLSLRAHFISYGTFKDLQSFLEFKRYIEFHRPEEYNFGQGSFIKMLLDKESNIGILERRDFENYLNYLITLSKEDVQPMTGIIVNNSGGAFSFFIFNSYNELGIRLGLTNQSSTTKSLKTEWKGESKRTQKPKL